MLLSDIREKAIRWGLSQGIITDESQVNFDAIDSDCYAMRASILLELQNSFAYTSVNNTITTSVPYDADIQESPKEYRDFVVPRALNGKYPYVGSSCVSQNIRITDSFAAQASTIKEQIPSAIRAFFMPNQNRLRVYSNMVKDITLNFIPLDPREAKDYNVDYDDFPLEDGLIPILISRLQESFYKYVLQVPIDVKPDSLPATEINQQ